MWHDSFICHVIYVTWLIHMHYHSFRVSFRSYVKTCSCATWRIPMCDTPHSCVTWLIHMCHMTHSYVRHDSFICEAWLIHMWGMTHSYVRHDSFICETWLIHMSNLPWGDMCSLYLVNLPIFTCKITGWVPATPLSGKKLDKTTEAELICYPPLHWMSIFKWKFTKLSQISYEVRWLWLVGSLKL